MGLDDILLHLDSYPEPTPDAGIDQAVAFARLAGGKLSALALAVDIPVSSNRLADYLVGLSKLEKAEEAKSLHACRAALDRFTASARSAGVFGEVRLEKASLYAVPEVVARHARTRDLCLVPLAGRFDGQGEVAVSAIFDSGRPVLVFKADLPNFAQPTFGEVVVAWDGGRCAARALSDALPLLKRAEAVRVFSVLSEKPGLRRGMTDEVIRHLQAHGVEAVADELDRPGEPIDATLADYLADRRPSLLVMGAYGHSRLREFVLGGATEFALQNAPAPVFLSH